MTHGTITIPGTGRDHEQGVLTIEVRILARRVMFGREEVQITPIAGTGTRWVVEEHVTPRKKEG